jgi:hypothetical protein
MSDNFLDEEFNALDLDELNNTGLNPVIPSEDEEEEVDDGADATSTIGPGNLEEPDLGEGNVGIMSQPSEGGDEGNGDPTASADDSPEGLEYHEEDDATNLNLEDDPMGEGLDDLFGDGGDLGAVANGTAIERQHPLEDFVHALDVEVRQEHIEHDEITSYQVTPETLVAFAGAILKEIDSASDELRAELNEAHRESQDGLAGARSDIEQARSLAEGASSKAHQAFQKANEPASNPSPDRRDAMPAAASEAEEEADVPAPKGRGRHNKPAKARKGEPKPAKVEDPGKKKTIVSGVGGLVIGILFFVVVVLVLGVITGQPILSDLGLALPL